MRCAKKTSKPDGAPEGLANFLRLCLTLYVFCRLRHIFVDERRSLNRAQGPADAEAAMVMGNSTRAWVRSYDLRFQRRGAENAVNAMPAWQQDMLASSQSLPSPVDAEAIEVDMNDLDE